MRAEEMIEQHTRLVIQDELARESSWSPAKSLSQFTSKVSHEYEGRFLIELIQNAHDAHPVESQGTGRITVRLDLSEGDHGCVYVANGGSPFSHSNFQALCDLASSDKPIGQGIGNKGIGFKSVLQVTEWPEIYSANAEIYGKNEFSGYCWVCWPDDLLQLVGGNLDHRDRIIGNISQYFLPVPARNQNATIRSYASAEYATVGRLPLRSAIASE